METNNSTRRKYSTFNSEYQVVDSLGEGVTSKVFLCRSLEDPKKQVALKLLRQEFLRKEDDPL